MKKILKSVLPQPVIKKAFRVRDSMQVLLLPRQKFDCTTLRPGTTVPLDEINSDPRILATWAADHDAISSVFGNDDRCGGVNPGDRRAVYHLIMALKPTSVLEIGTHIGASTLHIARALDQLDAGGKLITADIVDVNDRESGPWRSAGLADSPRGLADSLHCSDHVDFHVGPCLDLMKRTDQRFDFIFLDGDHSAGAVYKEVSAALAILAENGVILLHDYYPDAKSLYPDGSLISGPFRAMERVISENPEVDVLPLGELPWPTKLGSNFTSLALVVRRS